MKPVYNLVYRTKPTTAAYGLTSNLLTQWPRLKCKPKLNAKTVIVKAIEKGDVGAAKWWLERKARDEFGRDSVSEVPPEPVERQMTDAEMATVIEDYKKLTIHAYKQREMARIAKLGLPEAEKYGRYNALYALSDNQILLNLAKEVDEQLETRATAPVI